MGIIPVLYEGQAALPNPEACTVKNYIALDAFT